jgi:hypothetical protein
MNPHRLHFCPKGHVTESCIAMLDFSGKNPPRLMCSRMIPHTSEWTAVAKDGSAHKFNMTYGLWCGEPVTGLVGARQP